MSLVLPKIAKKSGTIIDKIFHGFGFGMGMGVAFQFQPNRSSPVPSPSCQSTFSNPSDSSNTNPTSPTSPTVQKLLHHILPIQIE